MGAPRAGGVCAMSKCGGAMVALGVSRAVPVSASAGRSLPAVPTIAAVREDTMSRMYEETYHAHQTKYPCSGISLQ